jgi:hypothetical protein
VLAVGISGMDNFQKSILKEFWEKKTRALDARRIEKPQQDFAFAPEQRVGDSHLGQRRRGGMADTADLKSAGS